MSGKAAQKYFARYAEPESHKVYEYFSESGKTYQHVLCIPAFDEPFEELNHFFNTDFDTEKLLVILVVNEPELDNSNSHIARKHIMNPDQSNKNNQLLIREIRNNFAPGIQIDKNLIEFFQTSPKTDLLLLNRTGKNAIPYHQGVGLARKIANDCAARLVQDAYINCPIIFNTDADARLPSPYFSILKTSKETAAWIYPFEHEEEENCKLYQQSLEYYVEGLKSAGSPYAFHTLGSTFAINANHYIQVRGYPKKNAGEDFYLLNKLAKTGKINPISSQPIRLSARASHRVPFGTGPKVGKIKGLGKANTKIFYHPDCFAYLKAFIEFWTRLEPRTLNEFQLQIGKTAERNSLDAYIFETVVIQFDKQLQLNKQLQALEHYPACDSQNKWPRKFHECFDAFQTLKLIHYLRDQYFPMQGMPDSISE